MANDNKSDSKPKRERTRNPFKGRAEALAADLLMRHEMGDDKDAADELIRHGDHVFRVTVEILKKKEGKGAPVRAA